MTRRRTIVSTLALMGAIGCVLPACASAAGPLLSGYGGPGAGEQEILGSQLLNGPSGAGSSAVQPSRSTAPASSEDQSAPVGEGHGTSAASSSNLHSPGTPSPTVRSSSSTGSSLNSGAAGKSSVRPVSSRPVVLSRASYDSRLGLSGGDLLLVILAACGLIAVGLLTRRLAGFSREQ